MSVQETEQLWGGETTKAVDNFPVSGERVPVVGRALARPDQGRRGARERRARAARRRPRRAHRAPRPTRSPQGEPRRPVPDRRLPDRLGHLVEHERQRGHRRRWRARARTPTTTSTWASPPTTCSRAPCTSPRSTRRRNALLPALERARGVARGEGRRVQGHRQVRPHAPDGRRAGHARPGVRAATPRRSASAPRRVRNALPQVAQIPLGGTATGTGLNTHPEFAARVRDRLSRRDRARRSAPPEDPFEAQANRDALVELSGALKVVAVSLTKIANDLALMGSGPRAGIGEIFLPELQKGSSIMPGKVNPVLPEVVLQVERAGDRQRHRDHDRRPAGPVRAQRAHPADRAQPAAVDPPADDRVASCSRRSASTASRPTSRAASARPRARSPSPPR